jgi:hypothetical protein
MSFIFATVHKFGYQWCHLIAQHQKDELEFGFSVVSSHCLKSFVGIAGLLFKGAGGRAMPGIRAPDVPFPRTTL